MNAATALAIKAGLDTIISIWGALERKPQGWEPSESDWASLETAVDEATPEARLALARLRAAKFPVKSANGATTVTNP